MNIKPLRSELAAYLKTHRLVKKFAEAKMLFEQDSAVGRNNHRTLRHIGIKGNHLMPNYHRDLWGVIMS